jgi:adenylate cyclase
MDWEAQGLLEGCADDAARAARRALLNKLHADGVSLEELRRAVDEQRLALLPVDRLLSSEGRYTAREIAQETGVDLDWFQTQRRVLGLAVPGPDERVYGEPDLESAKLGRRYREVGLPDAEALEAQRVLGRGMARYAEAVRTLVGQTFLEGGTNEAELASRLEAATKTLMPLVGPWLEYVFDLHMREALRQEAVTAEQLATGQLGPGRDTAVAFADLVGFTELGETIPSEELGSVAGRLSRLADDVVEPPTRIVKEIGDAVMLVSNEPADLVETALRLVDGGEGLPAIRAGVAYGPAVNRWGDWYGSTVNVASRLTERARPASVLTTEAVRDAAAPGFDWSFAGEKKLKGLSMPLKTYRVRRTGDGSGP